MALNVSPASGVLAGLSVGEDTAEEGAERRRPAVWAERVRRADEEQEEVEEAEEEEADERERERGTGKEGRVREEVEAGEGWPG